MPHRILLSLLSFFLIAPTVHAQVETHWGEMQKDHKFTQILNIAGMYQGNTLLLKSRGRNNLVATMVSISPDMREAKVNELEIRESGKKLQPEFCVKLGEAFYFFTSFRNQKLDRKFLFVQEMDPESLERVGGIKKVADVPYKSRYASGDFTYHYSRDSSHFLIFANVTAKANDPEMYNMYVFDRQMKSLWEKEVILPKKEKLFNMEDVVVDGSGNVYLTGISYVGKRREKRGGKPNYSYEVLAYRNGGQDEAEYHVSLKDQFITDLKLQISPEGDLICAGFYSDNGAFSLKGTYFITIDGQSGEILTKSQKEFDLDFITQNMSLRQERKAKRKAAKNKAPELYQYDLRSIVPRSDGGAVLVAEQYYIVTWTSYDPGTKRMQTNIDFYYNDIIVVNMDPQGQIDWATKIPKRQVSTNDGGYFSSFAMAISGGTLYFVYNDSKDNIEIEKQGKISNFDLNNRKGIIMLAKVDSQGNVERETITQNQEIETIARPKLCFQTEPDEMFLYGVRGKRRQYGVLKF